MEKKRSVTLQLNGKNKKKNRRYWSIIGGRGIDEKAKCKVM